MYLLRQCSSLAKKYIASTYWHLLFGKAKETRLFPLKRFGANHIIDSRICHWTTCFRNALVVGLFQYKKFHFDLDYTCLLRKLFQLGNSKPTQIIEEEFST